MFFNAFSSRRRSECSVDALQTRLDSLKLVLADMQQIAADLEQ